MTPPHHDTAKDRSPTLPWRSLDIAGPNGRIPLRLVGEAPPLIEIRGADPLHLVRIAWHLGNRHLPTQIDADRILIRDDHVIVDMLKERSDLQPNRVCIDHVEEHTVGMVLDAGFWAGMTLYPGSKCSPVRATRGARPN